MTALGLLHALALCLAVAAAGFAGLRLAGAAGARGLERVLAGATAAVAFTVAESLLLATVGLGASPPLLLAGCLAAAAVAARTLPAAAPGPARELAAWVGGAGRGPRAAAGALAGAGLTAVVWMWRSPALGQDGVQYHLAEIQDWVATGRPGAVQDFIYGFPVGAYPLTGEVSLGWGVALARSWAPLAPWNAGLVALGALGLWVALAHARVPVAARAAGLAALLLSPLVVAQLNFAGTDLPAAAWLGVGAGLVAAALRRPALLPFALVALALAVGTKTTGGPVAVALAALGSWTARGSLRALARPLAAAAVAAVAVGGVWYLRNLFEHGSPLWPFVAAPWGTEQPPLFGELRPSLLSRPVATLNDRGAVYWQLTGGIAVLAPAVLLAPLLVRRRAVLLASAAAALAGLIWTTAPVTGIADAPELEVLSVTTVRYLLPAVGLAVFALGIAARESRRGLRLAVAAGAISAAVSLERLRLFDVPIVPRPEVIAAGALAGAVLALLPLRLPARAVAVAAAALAVATVAVALAGDGFLRRHAERVFLFDQPVMDYFTARGDWDETSTPVFVAPNMVGPLAGDRLTHHVTLIPRDEPCDRVRARLRRGWVVVADSPPSRIFPPPVAVTCFEGRAPAFTGGPFRVYAPERR